MIVVMMILMMIVVILMVMLFQWRSDGSADIPTQDFDLSDEPIKEAVSRSALRTRGTLGEGCEFYISRCVASKGEVDNGVVSFALGTGGSGISNHFCPKSAAHLKM